MGIWSFFKAAVSTAVGASDRRRGLEPLPASEADGASEEEPVHPLCIACLASRGNVPQPWLEKETRGQTPRTFECSDEIAFPAIAVMGIDTPCAQCGMTGPILAVTSEVAASVARYLKLRGRPVGR